MTDWTERDGSHYYAEIDGLDVRLYWDDQPRVTPGWVAEYSRGGEVVDDSVKSWHPALDMGREALDEARRVAEEYARGLAARA